MITTMLAGRIIGAPKVTEGKHARLSAEVVAQLDRETRENWGLVAYSATVRSQIMAVGQGGRLAVAGVPRVSLHEGEISRTLFVENVLSLDALLPEEGLDD